MPGVVLPPFNPPSVGSQNPQPAASRDDAPKFTQISQPFNRQVNLSGMSPKQIQKLLTARGYDVGKHDGKLGARTKTAMDAYIKGKPPKQYNTWAAKHFRSVVVKGSDPKVIAYGGPSNVAGPPSIKPDKQVKPGGKAGIGALASIGSNIGVDTPEAFADTLANMGYGQAVTDAQRQVDRAPAQGAQNIHDIGHWYDQALVSQGTAAVRDKAIGDAGTGSVRDAVAAVVASLGGAANEGSGMVAASGQQDADMMRALANNQDQYNQDVRPILQAESAGQRARETVRQSNDMKDLQNKLTDAKTAKGQARIEALMKIRQDNNALAQQRFTNQLSLEQLNQVAVMNNAKLAGLGTSQFSPNTLAKASNGAMNQFASQDENGKFLGYDTKKYGPQQVVQMVNNSFLSMGLNLKDPRVAQSAMATLRALGIQPDPRWYR